jgi:predicted kinase
MHVNIDNGPVLFIFSGLPCAGKTTLATLLAKATRAAYLRVDTIEQALRELCSVEVRAEGYRLAYRIAADNLSLGRNVVADSCNPIELTRSEWEKTAAESHSRYVNVEVVCSDQSEHRRRTENRTTDIKGLQLPSWDEIQNREFHAWSKEKITIDTSKKPVAECLEELLTKINEAEQHNAVDKSQ